MKICIELTEDEKRIILDSLWAEKQISILILKLSCTSDEGKEKAKNRLADVAWMEHKLEESSAGLWGE